MPPYTCKANNFSVRFHAKSLKEKKRYIKFDMSVPQSFRPFQRLGELIIAL